jgi:two-component system KDP operon response regulator KdpE
MLDVSGSFPAPRRTEEALVEDVSRGIRPAGDPAGAGQRTGRRARILIIDPDPGSRRSIRAACAQDHEVMEAPDPLAGRRLAREAAPSLVFLDTAAAGDTAEGRSLIAEFTSSAPVILTSNLSAEAGLALALEMGADDYVVKPCRASEVLARIEAHLRRMAQVSEVRGVLRFAELSVDAPRRKVQRGDLVIDLTRNEFDLLLLLATSAGTVIALDRIVRHMWGVDSPNGLPAVAMHVQNLQRKIEPESARPQYILGVPGIGYRFAVPWGWRKG